MTLAQSPNRVVATIGLHGSASTWVFNVVRELMTAAYGGQRIFSLYAEKLEDLSRGLSQTNQHVVIKSHHGSADLDAWLDSVQPNIFLSVRDPRDASISMAQRFKAPLTSTVGWLMQDCRRMMKFYDQYPLLRYEDRFFERRTTVDRLSEALALTSSPELAHSIFDRYSTDATRSLAQKLTLMDDVTQIHPGHIGDTGSGKWRELQSDIRAALTRHFAPFLEQFGYLP